MCIFSKLCFGLQFTLIAFLFHFPQRHPSQIASLFSLKFLSLLRELASWISAPPISSLCFWLHDCQACHFWLHMAPRNVVLWSQEMREGPGSNTFLMKWTKGWIESAGHSDWQVALNSFFPSGMFSNPFPFPRLPNPGLCRWASPAWSPMSPLHLGCTLSGTVHLSFAAQIACIIHFFMIMLWLLPHLPDYMCWMLWWAAQIYLQDQRLLLPPLLEM